MASGGDRLATKRHTIHKKNGRVGEAVPGGFAGVDEFCDLCVFFLASRSGQVGDQRLCSIFVVFIEIVIVTVRVQRVVGIEEEVG